MPYCRPVPTQARQQADSSEGGFAKVAPLPIDHFFFFFYVFFCFPLGFPGLGLDMRWEFDGGHHFRLKTSQILVLTLKYCPPSILVVKGEQLF